jgi:hypothetical protein
VTKPEDHEVILNAVKSCMNKNALFFIRTFSLPSVKLTLEQVIENATHNISAFKWDLAKSLVNDKFTVNVRNIYSSYMKIKSRLDAKKLGWTAQDLATLEVYKSADQQYTFLPQSEQVSLFDKCGFNVIETFNSTLEGGSDSPLYVLQKK